MLVDSVWELCPFKIGKAANCWFLDDNITLSRHVSIYFNENIFDTKISEKVDFQFQNWWLLNNDFIMTYAIQESCTFKIGKSAKLMFSEWYLVWLMFLRKGDWAAGQVWVSEWPIYSMFVCTLATSSFDYH